MKKSFHGLAVIESLGHWVIIILCSIFNLMTYCFAFGKPMATEGLNDLMT